MKERGILFRAPMVRAILAGQKTQTRRPVKGGFAEHHDHGRISIPCPYGVVADRLWVRETFAAAKLQGPSLLAYKADGWSGAVCHDGGGGYVRLPHGWITGVADDSRLGRWHGLGGGYGSRWRSPLHMPRWASRITLEVTEVRVQRMHDITDEDARAEGIRELPLQEGEPGAWWTGDATDGAELHGRTPVEAYRQLWNSIHGADAWDANPWVWALTFRRVDDGTRGRR